jgi:hypothetical protein
MIWGSWPSRSSSFLLCPRGADGPRGGRGRSASYEFVRCSSCSCSPFVSIRRDFEFWLDGVSDGPLQRADGPRVRGGLSVCSPRTVRFSGFASGGSVGFNGQSAAQADDPPYLCGQSAVHWPTVRVARADSPPLLAEQSARACVLCFLLRFLSSLLVLPCVLQGIVPRTRGWSITSLSWRLVCDSIHRLCVTGIWLGYRPGSSRRIFTGSYSLPPSLVAIWSFKIDGS